MPYINSTISWENHREDCPNPLARRLYIRDYDRNGKQRFVPWGATCTNCGVIIKQDYEHNPIKEQIGNKRLTAVASKYDGDMILPRNGRETLNPARMKRAKAEKIRKRRRQMLGGHLMSPKENGYRRIIRGFEKLYEFDCYFNSKLRQLIKWNQDLVEEFLSIRPTMEELDQVIRSSPLHRYNNSSDYFKMKEKIPVKGSSDLFRPDRSPYAPDPTIPGHYIYNHDPNFISDYHKLVIKEAQIRKGLMRTTIIEHKKREHGDKDAGRRPVSIAG